MNKPISNFISESGIKALVEKGRKRGYLTVEEIVEVIPNEINSTDQLKDIITMIEDMGIEVTR